MDDAASKGHLEVVKYLHLNRSEGCSTYAMDWAANEGHLEIVKYLHLNRSEGCNFALRVSSEKGYFEVVKYLVENRLGLDRIDNAIDYAKKGEHYEIVDYLEAYLMEFDI